MFAAFLALYYCCHSKFPFIILDNVLSGLANMVRYNDSSVAMMRTVSWPLTRLCSFKSPYSCSQYSVVLECEKREYKCYLRRDIIQYCSVN